MTNANANAVVDGNGNAVGHDVDEQRDEYGRLASERIVELAPRDAEMINREVEAGKHDTYDDALAYVVSRGLAEIKRQREAAEALRAKSLLKAKVDSWKKLMELNPALCTDQNIVNKMLAELGIAKAAPTK